MLKGMWLLLMNLIFKCFELPHIYFHEKNGYLQDYSKVDK